MLPRRCDCGEESSKFHRIQLARPVAASTTRDTIWQTSPSGSSRPHRRGRGAVLVHDRDRRTIGRRIVGRGHIDGAFAIDIGDGIVNGIRGDEDFRHCISPTRGG